MPQYLVKLVLPVGNTSLNYQHLERNSLHRNVMWRPLWQVPERSIPHRPLVAVARGGHTCCLSIDIVASA